MNDQDYIRKAVELADGWGYSPTHPDQWVTAPGLSNTPMSLLPQNQPRLDALAAQLVRQRYQDDPDATVIYEQDVITTIKKLVDDS